MKEKQTDSQQFRNFLTFNQKSIRLPAKPYFELPYPMEH